MRGSIRFDLVNEGDLARGTFEKLGRGGECDPACSRSAGNEETKGMRRRKERKEKEGSPNQEGGEEGGNIVAVIMGLYIGPFVSFRRWPLGFMVTFMAERNRRASLGREWWSRREKE